MSACVKCSFSPIFPGRATIGPGPDRNPARVIHLSSYPPQEQFDGHRAGERVQVVCPTIGVLSEESPNSSGIEPRSLGRGGIGEQVLCHPAQRPLTAELGGIVEVAGPHPGAEPDQAGYAVECGSCRPEWQWRESGTFRGRPSGALPGDGGAGRGWRPPVRQSGHRVNRACRR